MLSSLTTPNEIMHLLLSDEARREVTPKQRDDGLHIFHDQHLSLNDDYYIQCKTLFGDAIQQVEYILHQQHEADKVLRDTAIYIQAAIVHQNAHGMLSIIASVLRLPSDFRVIPFVLHYQYRCIGQLRSNQRIQLHHYSAGPAA
jgi:hypothetical protein